MRRIAAALITLAASHSAEAAWPIFTPSILPRPAIAAAPLFARPLLAAPLLAAPMPAVPTAGQACNAAVAAAAAQAGVPVPLALGIARVETGQRQSDGTVAPWPWSINVEGTDHIYPTKAAAIAGVQAFQAAGARSIDVGCMQVNLMYHPDAFASLDDGFDPARNAAYAMRFLTELRGQAGGWEQAAARYHSATPELGASYLRKVQEAVADEGAAPVTAPMMAAAVRAPASAPPPMRDAGAIHLAAATPAGQILGMAAHGRSLADYRLIPIMAIGRR